MAEFAWGHERRYNSYSNYFKKHLGARVQKISIDAGFSCPNRDGSKGYGGCAYCNNDSFSPSYLSPAMPIDQQIKLGIEFHNQRYRRAEQYLAYFQSYSNTYAELERLQTIYLQAVDNKNIMGIVISTAATAWTPRRLLTLQK